MCRYFHRIIWESPSGPWVVFMDIFPICMSFMILIRHPIQESKKEKRGRARPLFCLELCNNFDVIPHHSTWMRYFWNFESTYGPPTTEQPTAGRFIRLITTQWVVYNQHIIASTFACRRRLAACCRNVAVTLRLRSWDKRMSTTFRMNFLNVSIESPCTDSSRIWL